MLLVHRLRRTLLPSSEYNQRSPNNFILQPLSFGVCRLLSLRPLCQLEIKRWRKSRFLGNWLKHTSLGGLYCKQSATIVSSRFSVKHVSVSFHVREVFKYTSLGWEGCHPLKHSSILSPASSDTGSQISVLLQSSIISLLFAKSALFAHIKENDLIGNFVISVCSRKIPMKPAMIEMATCGIIEAVQKRMDLSRKSRLKCIKYMHTRMHTLLEIFKISKIWILISISSPKSTNEPTLPQSFHS